MALSPSATQDEIYLLAGNPSPYLVTTQSSPVEVSECVPWLRYCFTQSLGNLAVFRLGCSFALDPLPGSGDISKSEASKQAYTHLFWSAVWLDCGHSWPLVPPL